MSPYRIEEHGEAAGRSSRCPKCQGLLAQGVQLGCGCTLCARCFHTRPVLDECCRCGQKIGSAMAVGATDELEGQCPACAFSGIYDAVLAHCYRCADLNRLVQTDPERCRQEAAAFGRLKAFMTSAQAYVRVRTPVDAYQKRILGQLHLLEYKIKASKNDLDTRISNLQDQLETKSCELECAKQRVGELDAQVYELRQNYTGAKSGATAAPRMGAKPEARQFQKDSALGEPSNPQVPSAHDSDAAAYLAELQDLFRKMDESIERIVYATSK